MKPKRIKEVKKILENHFRDNFESLLEPVYEEVAYCVDEIVFDSDEWDDVTSEYMEEILQWAKEKAAEVMKEML